MRNMTLLAVVLAFGIFAFSGPSHAELYFSGYLGAVIPHDADIEYNPGPGSGTVEFEDGPAIGAKLGYWFGGKDFPYLGLQIDLNATFPDLSKIDDSSGTLGVETDVEVYSAFVNALFRYPVGDLRPYLGAGGGWFLGIIDNGTTSSGSFDDDSDSAFGWQVLGGADWLFNPKLSVFVEYRYTRVDLEFDDPGTLGFIIDYHASQINAGVSYYF